MYFEDYLNRANLSNLQEFIKFGSEGRAENSNRYTNIHLRVLF